MNLADYSFMVTIEYEDYNGDIVLQRLENLTVATIEAAWTFVQQYAALYAEIGGCTIKRVAAIKTFDNVNPAPVAGETVDLWGLITSPVAATTPQAYHIIEIPAPDPAILVGNDIDLTNAKLLVYVNLYRQNVDVNNGGVLDTDGSGDTLMNDGVRVYRGLV